MIKWAATIENVETLQKYGYPIIVLSIVIFLCVFFFNWFQYRKKRASVKITDFIENELRVQNGSDIDQLAKVFDYKNDVNNRRWKRSENEKKEKGFFCFEDILGGRDRTRTCGLSDVNGTL